MTSDLNFTPNRFFIFFNFPIIFFLIAFSGPEDFYWRLGCQFFINNSPNSIEK
jgi:hypothetical protein